MLFELLHNLTLASLSMGDTERKPQPGQDVPGPFPFWQQWEKRELPKSINQPSLKWCGIKEKVQNRKDLLGGKKHIISSAWENDVSISCLQEALKRMKGGLRVCSYCGVLESHTGLCGKGPQSLSHSTWVAPSPLQPGQGSRGINDQVGFSGWVEERSQLYHEGIFYLSTKPWDVNFSSAFTELSHGN